MKKAIIFDFNRTLYDPEKGILVSGCLATLAKLSARYKLVLITNNEGSRQELIEELGIKNFFQVIVSTSNKNEQDFLSSCVQLNLDPGEVVVVGDRIKGEILIGNRLKMTTVHFKNGLFAQELPENSIEKPDFEIKKLEDLLKILPELQ